MTALPAASRTDVDVIGWLAADEGPLRLPADVHHAPMLIDLIAVADDARHLDDVVGQLACAMVRNVRFRPHDPHVIGVAGTQRGEFARAVSGCWHKRPDTRGRLEQLCGTLRTINA